jgi:predicted nucleic acid-binding protein
LREYTFDACALIALINEEEGAGMVDRLIMEAIAGEIALNISIINLSEVYYGYIGAVGKEKADDYLERILSYPIKAINYITDEVFRTASRLKGTYRISLADSYACATAMSFNAALVTSDHSELEPLEQHENLSVLWLPPRPKIK